MISARSITLMLWIVCLATPAWADFRSLLQHALAAEDAYNREDYATALREWRPLAEEGYARAQFYLGVLYANGLGLPQDYGQARQWYTKAAEQGDASAQYLLGVLYENGWGVSQDYGQARQWYTKAAEQGEEGGQFGLGGLYSSGRGVPQDYVQAHQWYNLAAAAANPKLADHARKMRDSVAGIMSPSQVAEAQRLAREWKPKMSTASAPLHEMGRSEPAASGTGFVISRQGHILTNHHVIDGCAAIRATTEGRTQAATVIGSDTKNDLAVLQLSTPASSMARFRDGRRIRSGDGVVVIGFPLHGVLAAGATVTTGTVSALAGIGSDTRYLQISAPVQLGNSGGPLLDQSGQVVGVVVSKLDALKVAKSTGDIPQNINFAINGVVAKAFLDSQSIQYETNTSSKRLEPAEIGAAAKKFTLLLECYR